MTRKRKRKRLGTEEPVTLASAGLKGPVKEITQRLYKAHHKPGQIFSGEVIDIYETMRNEKLCFDEDGWNVSQELWFHDKKTWKSIFDRAGNELVHQQLDEGLLESYSDREFDERGNMVKLTHHEADGTPANSIAYEYDEKGDNTVIRYYNKDGNLTETMVLTYDERGNKIDDYRTSGDGAFKYWLKVEYNDHGDVITYLHLNPDGSLESKEEYTHEYFPDGRLKKMNGRYIRQDRPLDYKELEHDRHGNWTAKVGFYNNVPALMIARSFSYYDGQEGETAESLLTETVKVLPYNMTTLTDNEQKERKTQRQEAVAESAPFDANLSPEDAKWIAEGSTNDNFSAMRYYVVKNNELPTVVTYAGSDIEVMALLYELKNSMDATVVHMYITETSYWAENKPSRYTLAFPNSGYLLQCTSILAKRDTDYWFSRYVSNWEDDDGYIRVSPVVVYKPSEASGKRDQQFEEQLRNIIDLCVLEKAPDKPEISMVEVQAEGKYKLTTYPVNDSFVISNLDMHYGYGFEQFHNDLMERFKKETRGLVLFHGLPGTGKTYYIRHLLRKMTSYNKVVIYMPPNMVEWLADPVFMTFMSKEISRFSKAGFFCVLLIEDAEPLLAVRKENGRVQGVSNLLNMTDGLLNDMLNLQIICTFNVRVKELDKALLRPGRLIARKEFRAMTVLDANRLAQQIGIKHTFTKPATLAEVYAFDRNKNTLIHDDGEKTGDE